MPTTPVTIQQFTALHPEFKDLACREEAYVQAVLDEQEMFVDREVYGNQADSIVMMKAALHLFQAPCGRSSGVSGDALEAMQKKLDKLMTGLATGCRVI